MNERRAEQFLAAIAHEFAKGRSLEWAVGDDADAVALIRQDPGFADRTLRRSGKHFGEPSAAPYRGFEDRREAERV